MGMDSQIARVACDQLEEILCGLAPDEVPAPFMVYRNTRRRPVDLPTRPRYRVVAELAFHAGSPPPCRQIQG